MSATENDFTEVTIGGTCWHVAREHRELILDEQGLRLSQWLTNGQAHVVKDGPHRTVYRVSLPGLELYLKHNRSVSTRSRLRQLLRPTKARLEHDRALAVAARHVPTITPLAIGEPAASRNNGDSYLLTRALAKTQALSTFLEFVLPTLQTHRQTVLRQRIAKSLGHFLARMHDQGIVHRDLHPANVLLRWDENDNPELYLIDLDAVQLRAPLRWRDRLDNLVILNRWFILRSCRSDRLRFWQAYADAQDRDRLRKSARELESRTEESNQQFWHGLDPRCLKNNRRFRKVASPGVIGHVVTDLSADVVTPLLDDPDEPFSRGNVQWLKRGRSSSVIEMEIPLQGKSQRVIYKRFNVTKWSDPLVSRLRPDAALRSWVNGHGLRQRWLPTPRPLAVMHRCKNGMLREGYLLTAKIEPADELNAFVAHLSELEDDERRRVLARTIDAVAKLVRQMHERQASHRDLKACNVLVAREIVLGKDDDSKEPHVSDAPSPIDHWPLTSSPAWLIDLVGVQCARKLRRSRKVQNLARLNASFLESELVTRTAKLRFLRRYLQWGLRGKEGWKEWWRAIERATRAKIARNARSGRPLK